MLGHDIGWGVQFLSSLFLLPRLLQGHSENDVVRTVMNPRAVLVGSDNPPLLENELEPLLQHASALTTTLLQRMT